MRLKRTFDNQSFSIEANGRINDFFTQTQWLPRLDHYWLGQPLFDDQLTWFEHSSAAYANIGIASTPTNPHAALPIGRCCRGKTTAPATRSTAKGERFITRQEIDWPIDFAPFKVVPYALGELGHWGEDINGDDIQRAVRPDRRAGQHSVLGRRSDDPRPAVQSQRPRAQSRVRRRGLLRRRQRKTSTEFPLYDELDDDSIEEFRRRLFFSPFGGGLAGVYYMPGAAVVHRPEVRPAVLRAPLRPAGLGHVAVDRNRRRPGRRAHGHAPPPANQARPARRASGSSIGSRSTPTPPGSPTPTATTSAPTSACIDYDFRWHLGDRFSILSDGYADTFGDGLRTASIGVLLNRPARGNAYLGFRTIGGLIRGRTSSTATVNYRMSPKWIGSASASIDFGHTGNIGQSFAFSRIGESLIATLGSNYDESKDNVGVSFLVEPRFLPKLSVGRKTGIEIPPVGAYGLE